MVHTGSSPAMDGAEQYYTVGYTEVLIASDGWWWRNGRSKGTWSPVPAMFVNVFKQYNLLERQNAEGTQVEPDDAQG
jgi:hypothetical protein